MGLQLVNGKLPFFLKVKHESEINLENSFPRMMARLVKLIKIIKEEKKRLIAAIVAIKNISMNFAIRFDSLNLKS